MRQSGTGGGGAVAEGSEQRFDTALTLYVVIEQLVNEVADVPEVLSAVDVFLIVLGGGSNVKVVAS